MKEDILHTPNFVTILYNEFQTFEKVSQGLLSLVRFWKIAFFQCSESHCLFAWNNLWNIFLIRCLLKRLHKIVSSYCAVSQSDGWGSYIDDTNRSRDSRFRCWQRPYRPSPITVEYPLIGISSMNLRSLNYSLLFVPIIVTVDMSILVQQYDNNSVEQVLW